MNFTIYQKLRGVFTGGGNNHKNHEGVNYEGQRIHSTISNFGGSNASNDHSTTRGELMNGRKG